MRRKSVARASPSYRLLFKASPAPMWVWDAKTMRFLDVNEAALAKYGYSRPEFLKMRASEIRPPEDAQRFEKMVPRLGRGMIQGGRWKHRLKSGAIIDVDIVAHRIRLRGRDAILSVIRDITELRSAEDRSRYLLSQQAAAVQASMDGMAILNADEKYIFLNEAHASIYGYSSPHDLVGRSWKILYDPQELRRFESEIMPELVRVGHWHGEAVGRRRDGSTFPQELSLFSIEGGGLVCVVRDATERKAVEQERERLLEFEKQARENAEQASRTKDEFLAMISHELRTPMTAMLGWIWALRQEPLSDSARRALDVIERNMKLQAQIVEDLLDVSQITSGKLHLKPRRVELWPVIARALEVVRPSADAKSLRLEEPEGAPAVFVAADPDRLQQVFWNILANAVKFTSGGGIVRVELREAGSCVEVSVSDSGQGISPDFMPYIFDRFRQAESAMTRSYRGLGLGLAIVRHLVEMHGGTVRAVSAGLGRGATFTVSLPVSVSVEISRS